MAAPTSPPPKRVALSALNVNTHSQSPIAGNSKTTGSRAPFSTTLAATMAARTPASVSIPPTTQASTPASTPLELKKRKIAVLGEEASETRPASYPRLAYSVEVAIQAGGEQEDRLQVEGDVGQEKGGEEGGFDGEGGIRERDADRSSQGTARPSLSPASTFAASQDSQDTAITEPEDSSTLQAMGRLDSFTIAATRISNPPAEVRELAETLKLRLQVALYKIRTNQLDLPLSQLEVRQSKKSHLRANSDPLLKSKHLLNLQEPPIWNVGSSPPMSDSPPPRSPRRQQGAATTIVSPFDSPEKLSFATPVLPRSRDGLRNIINESPERHDLTSSVVKGRAADGLLSLMAARP